MKNEAVDKLTAILELLIKSPCRPKVEAGDMLEMLEEFKESMHD